MKIHVHSLPAKAVLKDIQRELGSIVHMDLEENRIAKDCCEYVFKLPKSIGEGHIKGITFPTGFSLYQYDCIFYQDIMINFNISQTQPLKFIFCNEGCIDHSFDKLQPKQAINIYQNIIVAGSKAKGHNIFFEANRRVELTSLEINRPEFKKYYAYNSDGLTDSLNLVLNDTSTNDEFFYQGNYSLSTADVIRDLMNSNYLGFLKFLFINGTSNILLALQIEQFIDDKRGDQLPRLLRQRDLENVKNVISIVKGDMETNFSVDYLAREAGTNVNKLQEGFKYVYEMTVNKYIQQIKMDKAKNLLEHSDLNISEIVIAIGLKNRSYFSKIFKEEYGVSPRYFRKREVKKDIQKK